MLGEDNDNKQRAILLDALASYGDACTLPTLTPSCPYYENVRGVPTCEEQCRTLLADWGGGSRPVESHRQGGLVLTGRAIPRSSASGIATFDASERYLTDRALPLVQQRTGSLLLGLEAAMTAMPHPERLESIGRALDLWDELERRGVPVDAIVIAGILPTLATHIAALAVIPYTNLRERAEASSEMLERLDSFLGPWRDLVEAAFAGEGSEGDVAEAIRRTTRPAELERRLFGRQVAINGDDDAIDDGVKGYDHRSRLVISYALSGRFTDRVLDWFTRTLSDDKLSVLGWQAPPAGVFTALGGRQRLDEHGLWLWERNTVTNVEDWSVSSLLAEWRAHEVADHDLPQLVYGERSCNHEQVTALALRRLTGARHARPRAARGLKAGDLTIRAAELLRRGDYSAASGVFAGLVELRPWDGDALNNLGFCLMPSDPRTALQRLQEASLYPGDSVTINIANRVMCLTRLGRSVEAASLARESLDASHDHPSRERPCYVWSVDESSNELFLDNRPSQLAYLQELLEQLTST